MSEFVVHHDAAKLKALYRALWQRRFGFAQLATFAGAVGCFVGMMVMYATPWYLVAIGTMCLVGNALLVTSRETVTKHALSLNERIGPGGVRCRVTEAGLEEESPMGAFRLEWAGFSHRTVEGEYLVLWRAPRSMHAFIALPLDQIPKEARSAFDANVKDSLSSRTL